MQAEILGSPKERIRNILESMPADRTGILDLDFEFYNNKGPKESDKFLLFSFNGPFQETSLSLGLEEALIKFIREPRQTLSAFKDHYKAALAEYKELKRQGCKFDGAWMWEDIAYDKGLYFPVRKYRRQLFGAHRDICAFFASEGLPLFFHCDGKIEDLIPPLTEMQAKALHPLQEKGNPNILELKKALKGSLTFIGGVGLHRLGHNRSETLEFIGRLKEGGNYIFSFDGPIPDGFDKNVYNELLNYIKAQGI